MSVVNEVKHIRVKVQLHLIRSMDHVQDVVMDLTIMPLR